ncbi:sensor histidine kinase [Candidatus Entotheonella palauensis]|uniref:sensor histidine kinase n=1 Tax=Candidatus Entotheonella palauensis TaxID=93172 RepID=UPI0015C411E5|nr:ATP-binding protein [Candidatus Entotheonella palauensis]
MDDTSKSNAELIRELAELRQQVASMEHQEATHHRAAASLRAVVEGISATRGDDFFRSVAHYLASLFGVRYAFIGELVGSTHDTVNTLAFWNQDGWEDNFDYALAGTPCETVVGQTVRSYSGQMWERFPDDPQLKAMQIQCYLGAPMLTATGIPLGLVAVMHDDEQQEILDESNILQIFATRVGAELQRLRAEEALRQSEQRYRTLIEHSLQGISITRHGRRLFANHAFARTFGFERAQDVIGEDMRGRIAPHDQDRITAYAQARHRGEPAPERYQFQGVRKDGTWIWIENTVSVLDWEGEPATMSITMDITARKDLETVLQKANETLERQVKKRTVALEAANEEIKRFAYIVSHDLRAPLINIKGFANELRQLFEMIQASLPTALPYLSEPQQKEITAAFDGDIPESLEFIDISISRMDRLIQGVLTLSRAGNRDLQLEPVATEALVHDIVQSLTHQLTEHHTQVSIGPLPEVWADRVMLEQIWGNLLGNAVQYLNPDRQGEIVIWGECAAHHTIFQVRDNGRGIAENDVPRVFELFRRVGRQDTEGEGMGLAYVQTLVRRHGGEITCQSTLGAGTTFTFTIAHHLASGEPDDASSPRHDSVS